MPLNSTEPQRASAAPMKRANPAWARRTPPGSSADRKGENLMPSNESDVANQGADSVGLGAPREEPRTLSDQEVIDAARRVAECVIGPNAQATDQAPGPNLENFRALADAGLLGMGLPREVGGLGASGAAQREVTELLASYCGV